MSRRSHAAIKPFCTFLWTVWLNPFLICDRYVRSTNFMKQSPEQNFEEKSVNIESVCTTSAFGEEPRRMLKVI
jgi:hypothetical protein